MDELSKTGLVRFLTMMTEKGWINSNTGSSWKAAVTKILAEVSNEADVRTIDVEMEIRRFNNLHPGDLTPESLQTYGKRVKSAIQNFVSYFEDPQRYRPPGRVAHIPGKKVEKPKGEVEHGITVIEAVPTPPTIPSRADQFLATEANLALPFPLRPGYLAQVVIPRDMTKAEANRLCAFISTLAVSDD